MTLRLLLVPLLCSVLRAMADSGAVSAEPADSSVLSETNGASQTVVIDGAVMYAYGERLQSPFEFTGIGGDTLYINGLPYSPRWRQADAPGPEPVEISEASRTSHEIQRSVGMAASLAAVTAGTQEEAALRAFAVFDTSTHVDWVEITSNSSLRVKFSHNARPLTVFVPLVSDTPRDPPMTRSEVRLTNHHFLVDAFELLAGLGQLHALGAEYFMFFPKDAADALLAILPMESEPWDRDSIEAAMNESWALQSIAGTPNVHRLLDDIEFARARRK
jgi:hypothetical protein